MSYYIRYINLEHRKDREAHMQKELARIGLSAERHPAMFYKDMDFANSKYRTMFNRTPGAIGCYASQMQVMLDAYDAGKNAMVLEDDLIFCSDFKDRMKIIEEFIDNPEWDVIWLGGTYHRDKPYWHKDRGADWEPTSHHQMVRTFGAFSTHAYIVNKNSIQKIVEMIDKDVHSSIGIDFSFIRIQPQLLTYAFVPGCVKQIDNESSIGTGITHFSRFNKLGSHWFQDKMENYMEIKHRIQLLDLLKHFNITGPIAELGVAEGFFSADLLRAGAEFVYMIDNWGHIPGIRGDGNFPQEWHDKNYAAAAERVGSFSNVAMLRTLTTEAADEFRDNTFALVYHDADHSYEAVKRDIKVWWPKIKPGGIMAFHDYFMSEYGVRKAVEEFCGSSIDMNFIMESKMEDAGCWIRKPL